MHNIVRRSSTNRSSTFAITNSGGVPGFVFPQFGVFDALGNLYVADLGVNVIFIFTAAQLTSGSGTGLVPAAVFQISGSTGILGLAFNKGNLYLARQRCRADIRG